MNSLKKWLLTNALFSFLSGTSSLIFNAELQLLTGVKLPLVFPILGISLLCFVGLLVYVANKKIGNKLFINTIITMDVVWVIASIVLVAFQLFELTKVGYLIIVVIATFVALFAQKQYQHKGRIN